MVNMFNMGKFHNVRLAHNTYRPIQPQLHQPQQRMGLFGYGCHSHHHSGPTNVTINNGPQGFWGFMGGLFGGMLGGLELGNLFGGGMFGNYGMGNMYGMGGYPQQYGSVFNNLGWLNLGNTTGTNPSGASAGASTPEQAKNLKNLNELFKDYKIVPEEDGTFSAMSKDGKTILTGDYEEMKTQLAGDQAVYGKTSTEKKEEPKKDDPKKDTPKVDTPKADTPKVDTPKVDTPKVDTPKVDTPKVDTPKVDTPKVDTPKVDTPKVDTPKVDTPKVDTPKVDTPKVDTPKVDTPKVDTPKVETPVQNNNNKPTPVGANKVAAGTYNDNFTIHDDVFGTRSDINANSYTFGAVNAQGYPATITVKGNNYKFIEVRNGTAIYGMTKSNGVNEEYRLEQNANGKYALNQYKGDVGAGVSGAKPSTGTNTDNKTNKNNGTNTNNNVNNNKDLGGKPIPITFNIDISSGTLELFNTGKATASVNVNGKTYSASIDSAANQTEAMQKLSAKIIKQLQADGYTNIKLDNKNFGYTDSDKSINTQNVDNKTNWNNQNNRKKPMNLKISFSINTRSGNSGSASVTLPDGKKVTVETGPSLTSQRARADLANKIQAEIQKTGWTNVTLVNENFNWSSGPGQIEY